MSTGRGSIPVYVPVISYKYSVAGIGHRGSVISYKGYMPNLSDVKQLVARYPHGAEVDVSYDPDNPEVAVLECGVGFGNVLGAAAGLAVLAAGGIWFHAMLGAA